MTSASGTAIGVLLDGHDQVVWQVQDMHLQALRPAIAAAGDWRGDDLEAADGVDFQSHHMG
jgi:hypothetical protein